MRTTRTDIMGMPITVEVVGGPEVEALITGTFDYLMRVDEQFSTYKSTSEVSRLNQGVVSRTAVSPEFAEVLRIAEETKKETHGYFDITRADGTIDPSGIVKGWAVQKAAHELKQKGTHDFMIEAAGDIAVSGKNEQGQEWALGIRNPFNHAEIVKVIYPKGRGVATSGSAARGAHIYNPKDSSDTLHAVVSITVVGPDVLEADRFATAVFAMGKNGISFLEMLTGFEGYSIDAKGIATMTSGFSTYTTI